ncbi:class I SAM-dependent methyltransferase [Roseibium limicola]
MSASIIPGSAGGYAERVARHVPGLSDMHRMTALLLQEQAPEDAHVLIVGAGGGLELKAIADARPKWRFTGVDPSTDMLDQARSTLNAAANRIRYHQGYMDDAPYGPYDGATCLLTLHFLEAEDRLRTLIEIRRRLKPGGVFVAAHHSFSKERQEIWLARNAAFVGTSGIPVEQVAKNIEAMKSSLPVLSPADDVELLRQAGFCDVELFYAAFTFKGWVCRKA